MTNYFLIAAFLLAPSLAFADDMQTKSLSAINNEMHHNMEMPSSGDPDYDFAAMMVEHHKGAVEMAQVELQKGKDPELRQLAQGIIAAQQKEIAFMQDWLSKHPKK